MPIQRRGKLHKNAFDPFGEEGSRYGNKPFSLFPYVRFLDRRSEFYQSRVLTRSVRQRTRDSDVEEYKKTVGRVVDDNRSSGNMSRGIFSNRRALARGGTIEGKKEKKSEKDK